MSAERRFTIIMPDISEVAFLAKLLAYIAREAPHSTLRSVAMQPTATEESLESARPISPSTTFPTSRNRASTSSGSSGIRSCASCARTPHIGTYLNLEGFLVASVAIVRPAGRSHLFERFTEKRGVRCPVRLEVAHFTSLLTVIVESDLIATLQRDIGPIFARLANIRVVEPPIKPPSFDLKQHWHRRFHKVLGNIWLRRAVRGLFHD